MCLCQKMDALILFTIVMFSVQGVVASPTKSKSILELYKKRGIEVAFDAIYRKSHKDLLTEKIKDHRRSDVMMLYSIADKKYLQVKRKDRPGKFRLVTASKGDSSSTEKNMLFVTETVSFRKFKIKLAGKQVYLCARSSGKLSFKYDPSNREGKTRKRCLFHWRLTSQMHVRLFVETKNGTWHLSAYKNGGVRLAREDQTFETQRSFIWLPAQIKKKRPVKKHDSRQRNFVTMSDGSSKKERCKSLVTKSRTHQQKIEQLKKRLKYMEDMFRNLKHLHQNHCARKER